MKLILEIDLDNDAFQDSRRNLEIAAILERAAKGFRLNMHPPASLQDSNGNRVGSVSINN